MASSSSSSSSYFLKPRETNPQTKDEDEEKTKVGEKRDWLQLSLGSGFDSPSKNKTEKSSTTTLSSQQQQKMPVCLGLGLGLDNSNVYISSHNQYYYSSSHDQDHHADDKISVPPALPFRFRPQSSGIWFSLRSSVVNSSKEGEGGGGEMALPQIPKMYIRVKDEKVTVRTVKSYLVTKLGLSNQADQVEIKCNGEVLQNSQMLKDVRDTIWLPTLPYRTTISVSDNAPIYLMSLDYSFRTSSCFSNFS